MKSIKQDNEFMKDKNIKKQDINIDVENINSTSGIEKKEIEDKKDVIDPKTFKMPKQAEDTLDSYIAKLEDYYSKIGEEKVDVIAQKAKVLQAVLEADMLHTK